MTSLHLKCLIGIAGMGLACAWGQEGVMPLAASQAEQSEPARSSPTALPASALPASALPVSATLAYVDRLIDATNLPALDYEDDAKSYETDGWPRALRIEARGNVSGQSEQRRREGGLIVNARIDTPHYGAWAVDAALRLRPGRDSLFTVSQRGMPFDGGWLANSSAGMLVTPAIDLTRTQSRFFLPGFGMVGAATEWMRGPGLQLHASAGQSGRFESYGAPGFSRRDGSVVTAGGQWSPVPGWQAGMQFADVRRQTPDTRPDAEPFSELLRNVEPGSGRSWFGAAAWTDTITRLQANVVQSSRAGQQASGIWLDANTRQGQTTHHFGIFNLEPGLSWGPVTLNNDIRGSYYRVSHLDRRWHWHAGIDQVSSISGRGRNGLQVNGSARYRLSQTLSAGAGAYLRHTNSDAWSGYSYIDWRGSSGNSRVQLDLASDSRRDNRQLSFDHSWHMPIGTRLAASATLGQEDRDAVRHNHWTFAVTGGADLNRRTTFDGNLRVHASQGDGRQSGMHAGIGLTHRFGTHWSVSGSYYEQRGKDRPPAGLEPLFGVPDLIETPPHRALFFVLRHEARAGSGQAPLGGKPGSGAGAIHGYVYLDANDNGVRDADEAVAPDVMVLLDGRFPARTDAQGRFEFPMVVSGQHAITVVPDNLPLPWALADDGRRIVTVPVRNSVTLEVPAVRIK